MMIGHYSAGLLAKALDPRLPLWVLFLAVQLVDVVWAVLVAVGVERVELVEGFTASNPLDLRYMPYSHSLTATVAWAGAAALVFLVLKGRLGWRGSALLVGAAVLSHWFLDVLVHVPDMPVYGDACKQGLGLWNYAAVSLAVEAALFFGAMALYYRATRPRGDRGRWAMLILGLVLLAIQVSTLFGPVPPSHIVLSATGLFTFIGLAAVAAWLDRKREPRAAA